MTDFLQRCEEENQSAFEIQEPKLTGKVIGKAIVAELEKFSSRSCCTKL